MVLAVGAVRVGSGGAVTVSVALATGLVPPAPVQVSEYTVVALGETETFPDVPDGVKLVPVQLVALVEPQVRVADTPLTMDVGLTASEAVGTGGGGVGSALGRNEVPLHIFQLYPLASAYIWPLCIIIVAP